MKLDADGARARHQGEDRRPARSSTRSRRRRRSSRSRSPRCRSRCARSRSRRATIRATSRWWRRAAPARCTSVAIARELHIPKVIVPLFPSHFSALGMLLADERHDFIRTFYSDLASVDFASSVEGPRRDGRGSDARACATPTTRERQIHLDLRYVGQEFTLQVPVDARAARSGRSRRRSAAAFDALYEHRYAHHSPDEPVEMVNIRLGADRQARRSSASRASPRAARATPARRARGLFHRRAQAARPARSIARETLGAGSEIAGPALIQEHGTTTVLFEQRRLSTVAPTSGELIITVGSARDRE